MEVHLTPDQEAFIRQAIESGRLQHQEDAVKEALALWEERERTRAEILASLDEAEASLARGEGVSSLTSQCANLLKKCTSEVLPDWLRKSYHRADGPSPHSPSRG